MGRGSGGGRRGECEGNKILIIKFHFILVDICVPRVQEYPVLTNPSAGNVTTTKDSLTMDQQATYTCNYGYILSGNDTRVCQVNATWSGNKPDCTFLIACSAIITLRAHSTDDKFMMFFTYFPHGATIHLSVHSYLHV